MTRLIDSERLRQRMKICSHLIGPFNKHGNIVECSGEGLFTGEILDVIDEATTISAVPVVHGEWTIDGMNEYELSYGCVGYEPRYRCSKCGITTESYLRTEKPIMPEDADFPNYCPYCGAKMDGERKDGERDV